MNTDPNHSENELHPIIQTKCPACGWKSLFIGSGGYLTCGNLDCPTPIFDAAIQAYVRQEVLKAQVQQLRSIRDSDVHLNHGTIELLAYMSQELNKQKHRAALKAKGASHD